MEDTDMLLNFHLIKLLDSLNDQKKLWVVNKMLLFEFLTVRFYYCLYSQDSIHLNFFPKITRDS